MTEKYKQAIEISSDHENAVENFIHEVKKQANEGERYGVRIEINRIEPELAEVDDVE